MSVMSPSKPRSATVHPPSLLAAWRDWYAVYMSTTVLSLRIPTELKERLDALAERTGRTVTFYALEAIEDYVEDMEDAYLGDEAYHQWEAEGFPTYSLSETRARLGL